MHCTASKLEKVVMFQGRKVPNLDARCPPLILKAGLCPLKGFWWRKNLIRIGILIPFFLRTL